MPLRAFAASRYDFHEKVRLEGLAAGGLDELLAEAGVGVLPLIYDLLIFDELFLEELDATSQSGVACRLGRVLGAYEGGFDASGVVGAGLEEGEVLQAILLACPAIDETDGAVDFAGGEELLDGADVGGAVEVVVTHLDKPIHLQFVKHGSALPAAVPIV